MHVSITASSGIPITGYDFIGIVDRGTNLLEVKPTTTCNLRCAYCYASSGHYVNDFEVQREYLLDGLRAMVERKGINDIEVHLDPYGEVLLYKDLEGLISGSKTIKGVSKVSLQTNGTLFTPERARALKEAGLDQANVTLNGFDARLLARLSGRTDYDGGRLVAAIHDMLDRGLDVVITPVWFFGLNDADIAKIVDFYLQLKEQHGDAVRLGIQNYLVYKTGRKLGKVKQRDFGYFYQRLRALERERGTKLLLGPSDFGIHPAATCKPPFAATIRDRPDDHVTIEIASPGRQAREWLGRLDGWGVKIVNFSDAHVGNAVTVPGSLLDIKGSLASAVIPREGTGASRRGPAARAGTSL